MSTRPDRLVVVAGTGTEVGKTWVTTRLTAGLCRRGFDVGARKPAQSYDSTDPPEQTDAALLGAATGEDPTTVCPPHRWYPVAMAPPMAADSLGREQIRLEDLLEELDASWVQQQHDIGVVELAGGLWSPIAHDGDCLELTRMLSPDVVVLIADAGLGTLNSIRPAVASIFEFARSVVFLNRYDDWVELHRRNAEWLRLHDGIGPATSLDELIRAVTDRR